MRGSFGVKRHLSTELLTHSGDHLVVWDFSQKRPVCRATRQTLNNLVNDKSGISADMAIRLGKAFGGDAETWLRLQIAYDLAQARQHEGEVKVKPVARCNLHEPRP